MTACPDKEALLHGLLDGELDAANARAFEEHVAGETLAVEVVYDGDGVGEAASIEGRELRIGVARQPG